MLLWTQPCKKEMKAFRSLHKEAAVEDSTSFGLGGMLHIVWPLNEVPTAGATVNVNQPISTKWHLERLTLCCSAPC